MYWSELLCVDGRQSVAGNQGHCTLRVQRTPLLHVRLASITRAHFTFWFQARMLSCNDLEWNWVNGTALKKATIRPRALIQKQRVGLLLEYGSEELRVSLSERILWTEPYPASDAASFEGSGSNQTFADSGQLSWQFLNKVSVNCSLSKITQVPPQWQCLCKKASARARTFGERLT